MLKHLDMVIGFAVVMLGLSLVITTLIQMISALLSLRGTNLRWGLETLFQQIDPTLLPNLKAHSRTVAEKVLTHCLVSDSMFSSLRLNRWNRRFQLANAIRPRELAAILRQMADDPGGHGIEQKVADDIKKLLKQENPDATRVVELVALGAGRAAAAAVGGAAPLMQAAVDEFRNVEGRLEAWFGSVMDRVSQRFATKMRTWTVALAVIVAFGMDLDSVRLAGNLASNDTLRAGLVAAMEPMLATASAAGGDGAAAARAGTALHEEALKRALAARGMTAAVPTPVATQSDAEKWLVSQVQGEAAQKELIDEYRGQLRTVGDEFARRLAGRISDIRQTLDKAGLDVLPAPVRSWPWEDWAHFFGVLITCALLSLGAPFWFNLLKSLSNLRPVLASKEKQEQQKAA